MFRLVRFDLDARAPGRATIAFALACWLVCHGAVAADGVTAAPQARVAPEYSTTPGVRRGKAEGSVSGELSYRKDIAFSPSKAAQDGSVTVTAEHGASLEAGAGHRGLKAHAGGVRVSEQRSETSDRAGQRAPQVTQKRSQGVSDPLRSTDREWITQPDGTRAERVTRQKGNRELGLNHTIVQECSGDGECRTISDKAGLGLKVGAEAARAGVEGSVAASHGTQYSSDQQAYERAYEEKLEELRNARHGHDGSNPADSPHAVDSVALEGDLSVKGSIEGKPAELLGVAGKYERRSTRGAAEEALQMWERTLFGRCNYCTLYARDRGRTMQAPTFGCPSAQQCAAVAGNGVPPRRRIDAGAAFADPDATFTRQGASSVQIRPPVSIRAEPDQCSVPQAAPRAGPSKIDAARARFGEERRKQEEAALAAQREAEARAAAERAANFDPLDGIDQILTGMERWQSLSDRMNSVVNRNVPGGAASSNPGGGQNFRDQ